MIENEKKIIDNFLEYLSKYNISIALVQDIIDTFSILAINNSDSRIIDIDTVHSSNDKEFNRIIPHDSNSNKELSDIAKLRLLSDSLLFASLEQGVEVSTNIVRTLSTNVKCDNLNLGFVTVENANKDVCLKNLEIFFKTLLSDDDYSWYKDLEDKLVYYDKLMKSYDCKIDLLENLKKRLNQANVNYPFDNIFVDKVNKDLLSSVYKDDIKTYTEETICSALICMIISRLKVMMSENKTYTNYCLLTLSRQDYDIGTYSKGNYIPRIIINTDFPVYIISKLHKIFNENNTFSIVKLESLIKILIYISSVHATDVTKDISDMKITR